MTTGSDWYRSDHILLEEFRQSGWGSRPVPRVPGYEELRELRRGGQGIVYEATQRSTRRRVAIKVLLDGLWAQETQRRRFEREIDLIATLRHPNIVQLYDSGVTDSDNPYYVMEFIAGVGLDEYARCGPNTTSPAPATARAETTRPAQPGVFDVRQTLHLFARICDAINYAHQRGVIHRDIKPSNIRVDPEGQPHVLDFGLAKSVPGPLGVEAGAEMSLTGEFMGSLPWASPEQTEGLPDKIDIRTDVYSLGVVLYQLLTGRFPYTVVAGLREVLDSIHTAEPPPPSRYRAEIDDETDTIVLKCLAKQPARRYQSAGELARDIRHYLAGEPIEAKRDSASYVLRKQLQRYRLPVAAAAAFVLIVTAGFVTSLTFWRQAVRQRDEAQHEAAVSTAVTAFLEQILGVSDPYGYRWADKSARELSVADALAEASKCIETAFADQPDVEVAARTTLGRTFLHLGQLPDAATHLVQAVELGRRVLGEEHPTTLAAMFHLAEMHRDRGEFSEAVRLYRHALSIRRRDLGSEHADTLACLRNLALTLTRNGDFAEAEPLYHEALEMSRRVLGEKHFDTLTTLSYWALQLTLLERVTEAEQANREVYAGYRELLGDEHPLTLLLQNCMADMLRRQGKYDEGIALARDALAKHRRVQGDKHPDTLILINNLGLFLRECGQLEEAEVLAREALAGYEVQYGAQNPETLILSNNLAETLRDQGRLAEAETLFEQLEQTAAQALKPEHWLLWKFRAAHGLCLMRMQRFDEAEALLTECHAAWAEILGAEQVRTVTVADHLVELYEAWSKPADAAHWRAVRAGHTDPADAPNAAPASRD
ncbi:MAG: serine/threonine-protein kinase [Planctomycetes bacterium]|nr:serine/threonine-protein kinase [Planctomycetota bacterium]